LNAFSTAKKALAYLENERGGMGRVVKLQDGRKKPYLYVSESVDEVIESVRHNGYVLVMSEKSQVAYPGAAGGFRKAEWR